MNKRRAARMAAVQALYQIELNGQTSAFVIEEFKAHRLAALLQPLEPEIGSPKVDREWFELIVKGAWASRQMLDARIGACLAENWTLARCGFLLRACLRAGAFELAERTDVPINVVISEYVEVARLFLGGDEPGFVNAVLDRLAPQLRVGAGAGVP